MNGNEQRETEIAELERWLAAQPSPEPGEALLDQVKLAVRSEAALQALDAEACPQPSLELIGRVKSAVRAEARRVRSRSAGWPWWTPLAAAALLAVAVLGPWRALPGGTANTATADYQAVDELIVALADVFDLDRPIPSLPIAVDSADQPELETTAESDLALESVIWEMQLLVAGPANSQISPG
jgi:hypothetical protein